MSRSAVFIFASTLVALGLSGCIGQAYGTEADSSEPGPGAADEQEVAAPEMSHDVEECVPVTIYNWHGQLAGSVDFSESFHVTETLTDHVWLVETEGSRVHAGFDLEIADAQGHRLEKIEHEPEADATGSSGRAHEAFLSNMTAGSNYSFTIQGIGYLEHIDAEISGQRCE